jgi:hypothetical protein
MHLPTSDGRITDLKSRHRCHIHFIQSAALFCCTGGVLEKVYQPAIALTVRGGRVIAETHAVKGKGHNHHSYDDQTIENMVRYYKVEENFDTLLKYIKNRGLQEDVL